MPDPGQLSSRRYWLLPSDRLRQQAIDEPQSRPALEPRPAVYMRVRPELLGEALALIYAGLVARAQWAGGS